jgi:hypothetical protein
VWWPTRSHTSPSRGCRVMESCAARRQPKMIRKPGAGPSTALAVSSP